MMKIIVRADLPLWYTEGFNPKPKLTFAAPLSIGTESTAEYMDIRLTEKIPPEVVMAKLNANMTREMQVTEVYYPESKLSTLGWLAYTIKIELEELTDGLLEKARGIFEEDSLVILKKTKSGEAEVDIKPLIKNIEVKKIDGSLTVECILSAEPSSFLNPEYIVKILKSRLSILSEEKLLTESYSIMRHAAYFSDMTDFK
jgi:radical SAM-linked protein